MGILGALSTAVSGLSAQAYALENISGNIANSQTVGFKRVNTSFVDLIPDAPTGRELAGSVVSYSKLTNTIQGTLRSTGVTTNMALSGDGYFAIVQNNGSTANPTFSGERLYTRRGDFSSDAQGYLVNGSGHYLVGTTYNPATGAVIGASTSPLKLSNDAIPARATTVIDYSGNLPSLPKPANYSPLVPGSQFLIPADYATNPVSSGTVTADDQGVFLNQSIAGGEVTLYNSAGTAATAQLRWGKVGSSGGTDTWMLFYQTNSSATGTGVAWKSVGADVEFDSNGQMTSSASQTVTALTIDGTNVGDVSLSFAGNGGLTQYGDANGEATPAIDQNGYTAGKLLALSLSEDGVVTGNYSNGQSAKMGQVTIAHFAANDALKRESGGAFSATPASGSPTFGLNGTTLTGGSVEESNTDISDEFSKMIVTQQAYSANTRVMSTAQQMLQDVINVIR